MFQIETITATSIEDSLTSIGLIGTSNDMGTSVKVFTLMLTRSCLSPESKTLMISDLLKSKISSLDKKGK